MHGAKLDGLLKKVKSFNEHYGQQLSLANNQGRSSNTGKTIGAVNRTLCQPTFQPGDQPADPLQAVTVNETMSKAEFENAKELLA